MNTARRKSATVTLGVTALLAAGLTGCASNGGSATEEVDYQAVCVDQATEQRIEDEYCDTGGQRYHGGGIAAWYFLSRGLGYPRMGGKVTGGTFRDPGAARTVQRGGAPAGGGTAGTVSGGSRTGGGSGSGGSEGDTVSRGGFGSSNGSSGS
jgi:hypothetical protein